MAGKPSEQIRSERTGKRFNFHGSFNKKSDAVAKEKEVSGFIREKKVGGHVRYFVLTSSK